MCTSIAQRYLILPKKLPKSKTDFYWYNLVFNSNLKTQTIIDKFIRAFSVDWIHITFIGRYNFNKKNAGIDI